MEIFLKFSNKQTRYNFPGGSATNYKNCGNESAHTFVI